MHSVVLCAKPPILTIIMLQRCNFLTYPLLATIFSTLLYKNFYAQWFVQGIMHVVLYRLATYPGHCYTAAQLEVGARRAP